MGRALFSLLFVPILYGIIIAGGFFGIGLISYHTQGEAGPAAIAVTIALCLAAHCFATHALFGEIGKAYLRRGWRLLAADPAEYPAAPTRETSGGEPGSY